MRDRLKTADGRHAMTLVELMIVSSIILMLVVISVPVVRPMLMSRKQADAAQILSIYLNSARIRASETGRDCGVMFERFTDNNINGTIFPNNDSCLVIRQVEVPPPYVGMDSNVRVSVEHIRDNLGNKNSKVANIIFHKWDGNGWSHRSPKDTTPVDTNDPRDVICIDENAYWNNMIQRGDKIQFDSQGPFYTIVQEGSVPGQTVAPGNENAYIKDTVVTPDRRCPMIAVQNALPGNEYDFNIIREISRNSPVPFKVLRLPKHGEAQLTLTPPVGFPSGIIVDLQYSGIGFSQSWYPSVDALLGRWGDIESDFKPSGASDNAPVIVMFSPSGTVSLIRSGNQVSPSGPIHFLVGRWDRAASDWRDLGTAGSPDWYRPDASPFPPEDELRNFQDLSNFWVTIDPNTGRVRTNPVAPSDIHDQNKHPLVESRRYANRSQ